MKVTAANYEQMRQWFATVVEAHSDLQKYLTADNHPLEVLDSIAARSPARARAGLGTAIGDMIESVGAWQPDAVAALDRKLHELGLPRLSAIWLEFDKRIGGILKRGRIRNEAEYYLARNAAEMAGMPEDEIWKLLAAYEASERGETPYSG